MRNSLERNNRLENMCWRIWHLARRQKQIEWDDAQRLAKRRIEREQGRRDATEDMSEDLSEGEKTDVATPSETPKRAFTRNFSDLQVWSDDDKGKRLYIVLISLHGLVRGEGMGIGLSPSLGLMNFSRMASDVDPSARYENPSSSIFIQLENVRIPQTFEQNAQKNV